MKEDASRAVPDSFEKVYNEFIRVCPENPHKIGSKDYFLFETQQIRDFEAKIDEELELLRHRLGPNDGTQYNIMLNFEPEMKESRKRMELMRKRNNNGHPAQEEVGNKPENQNNIAINPDDEKSA